MLSIFDVEFVGIYVLGEFVGICVLGGFVGWDEGVVVGESVGWGDGKFEGVDVLGGSVVVNGFLLGSEDAGNSSNPESILFDASSPFVYPVPSPLLEMIGESEPLSLRPTLPGMWLAAGGIMLSPVGVKG